MKEKSKLTPEQVALINKIGENIPGTPQYAAKEKEKESSVQFFETIFGKGFMG